ncbi:ABC-three component system middle component 5 [uncultured Desulfovibrio sp.]|uniref:ABC-three component system middle component 5 n=1 Tax=uncultured Desulfovibrio sp. TaxID=167968 RepID=UPI002868A539|nr:ABC-three component system middle component 5 [uncultured Desulfovibrio sp.]
MMILFNSIYKEFTIEQVRIFDFMIAFPSYLKKIRKTKNVKIRATMNKYEFSGSFQQCFYLMEQIQISALLSLVAKNIVLKNENKFIRNINFDFIYNKISSIEKTKEQDEALSLIVGMLSDINTCGKDGLKDRTNLMESLYDPRI